MTLVVPIDDYSPVYQSDTANPLSIQVLHKNGFSSILGATITMKLQNVDDPSIIKTCSGDWQVDTSDNGKASYQYQAGDLDTVGSWFMWVKIVIGSETIHPDDGEGSPKILVVDALPVGV